MSDVNVLVMQKGLLTQTAIVMQKFLDLIDVKDGSQTSYLTTAPAGMNWDLFRGLSEKFDYVGFRSDADEVAKATLISGSQTDARTKPFWASLEDPTDEDEFTFSSGVLSDIPDDDFCRVTSGSRWIGLRYRENRSDSSPIIGLLKKTNGDFVVNDFVEKSIREFDALQVSNYLDQKSESWDIVDIPRPPRILMNIPSIFEAVAKIGISDKVTAIRKEDKITELRSTVLNLGGQSQGKTASELAEHIQETLHELAEHHEVADTLVAFRPIKGDRELGPLVSKHGDWEDGYSFNEQVGALARESGGVVAPRVPLLSRIKDLVLVSPMLDDRGSSS